MADGKVNIPYHLRGKRCGPSSFRNFCHVCGIPLEVCEEDCMKDDLTCVDHTSAEDLHKKNTEEVFDETKAEWIRVPKKEKK